MLNINKIIGKFIKNSSQRELDRLKLIVEKINGLEQGIKQKTNESFPLKTTELRSKVRKGVDLDDLIPETFAYVREASRLNAKI